VYKGQSFRSGDPTPVQSSLAAWRVSLRRMRADWLIVAAAWLIAVLAATLLAAGPIYASAVSLAGLHRVLAEAPTEAANIQASVRVQTDVAAEVSQAVVDELTRVSGPLRGSVVRLGRSETFALPGQPDDEVRDLAVLGFITELDQHASLVDGQWPSPAVGSDDPIQVVVGEHVAEPLGLRVGDTLELQSRVDDQLMLAARIQGIFRITDENDPVWFNEAQMLDGLTESDQYRTFGPLLTAPQDLIGRVARDQVLLQWRLFPDFERLTIDAAGSLRARVQNLGERLDSAVGGAPASVVTNLDQIIATAERSLLASRTGVLLLMAQLAVLAGYAILLTAALLVDHRRVDTALLRSRGAGTLQVAGMALTEGLFIALSAGLAAPWLAAGVLRLFNLAGPLADVGLRIEPGVTNDSFLAAGAAGAACVMLLVLPALLSARTFAAEHGAVSRQETRPIGQRIGLDFALLAIAGLGFWQLRLYGAPLTESVRGTLGLDPLLVGAPAIGLLAGAVVALRLVPLLAQLVERAVVRGRGLVSSLGARQVARRPLRYTRAALMLMLAMAMGVFALFYTVTWTQSQRDQAEFQVGADVRVTPGRSSGTLPRWELDAAYAALPGETSHMPVMRQDVRISRAAGAAQLLALDAAAAPGIVRFRPDLADAPLASLLTPLEAARPAPAFPSLAGEPTSLQVTTDVTIRAVAQRLFDFEAGAFVLEPADVALVAGVPLLNAAAVVRDARGELHRFFADPVAVEDGEEELRVPLGSATDGGPALAHPLELVSVELAFSLPTGLAATSATATLSGVAAGTEPAGDWQPVDLEVAGEWRLEWSVFGARAEPVPSELVDGLSMRLGDRGPFGTLNGIDRYRRGTTLSFTPASLSEAIAAPLPVIANEAFLEATATRTGDPLSLTLFGRQQPLMVSGVVRSFPTTEPDAAAFVADLPTLNLLRFGATHATSAPDEWWLAVEPAQTDAVVAQLEAAPFSSVAVASQLGRARSLGTDPVALGIIGALALGVVAAGLFAVIGLVVSAAVSARERLTEFALLRALGLSSGQLSGWLSLENSMLAVVSLLAGTGLGLLIGWVALPFVTVTQQAAVPFPPVIVSPPWSGVLLLEAIGVVTLAVTVALLARLLRRLGIGSTLRMGED
jgi:ABC-type lipoprotein release transport system permease subunit